ncbi:MAG TPA: hypothetical protein ENK24_02445, partial [Anaerolineae bacterium]|nr:hypothetical protein [Anaerolineae bacterium]
MTPRFKIFLKLTLLLLLLLACRFGGSYPEEAARNVKDGAIRTLRTDKLGSHLTGLSDSIELKVVDVTLNDGSEERRAFLVSPDDNYEYLGRLQKLAAGVPLDALVFSLNGRRFMIFWVDKTLSGKPVFVTVARPEQLSSDDSMSVLGKGEAANRVVLIYIPENQASLWQELTYLRISGRG